MRSGPPSWRQYCARARPRPPSRRPRTDGRRDGRRRRGRDPPAGGWFERAPAVLGPVAAAFVHLPCRRGGARRRPDRGGALRLGRGSPTHCCGSTRRATSSPSRPARRPSRSTPSAPSQRKVCGALRHHPPPERRVDGADLPVVTVLVAAAKPTPSAARRICPADPALAQ